MAKFYFKVLETREVFSLYTVTADNKEEAIVLAEDGQTDCEENGESTITNCSILYRCDKFGNEISAEKDK